MSTVAVRRLALVGTGLIGASVGLAARRAGVPSVVAWDPDPQHLAVAAERDAVEPAPTWAMRSPAPRSWSSPPRSGSSRKPFVES